MQLSQGLHLFTISIPGPDSGLTLIRTNKLMPHPLLIVSQSDHLNQVVDMN